MTRPEAVACHPTVDASAEPSAADAPLDLSRSCPLSGNVAAAAARRISGASLGAAGRSGHLSLGAEALARGTVSSFAEGPALRGGSWTGPSVGVLEGLSMDDCLALLRSHSFGRLAVNVRGSPLVLPVNYAFDEPSVAIRTAPGTKLEHSHLTMVGFEIDEAAPDGSWGWSVTVQGPAFDITDSMDAYSEALRRLPVVPWVPGEHCHWLKVTAEFVSGRRFGRREEGDDENA